MTNFESSAPSDGPQDTVWVEQVSWIDRIPRSVSMLFVFVVFIFMVFIFTMIMVIVSF